MKAIIKKRPVYQVEIDSKCKYLDHCKPCCNIFLGIVRSCNSAEKRENFIGKIEAYFIDKAEFAIIKGFIQWNFRWTHSCINVENGKNLIVSRTVAKPNKVCDELICSGERFDFDYSWRAFFFLHLCVSHEGLPKMNLTDVKVALRILLALVYDEVDAMGFGNDDKMNKIAVDLLMKFSRVFFLAATIDKNDSIITDKESALRFDKPMPIVALNM